LRRCCAPRRVEQSDQRLAGNNTIVVTDYAGSAAHGRSSPDRYALASAVDVVRLENTIASDMAAAARAPPRSARAARRSVGARHPSCRADDELAPHPGADDRAREPGTHARGEARPALGRAGNIHVVYLKNANATVLGAHAPRRPQRRPITRRLGTTPGQSQPQLGSRPVGTAPSRADYGAPATPQPVSAARRRADPGGSGYQHAIVIAPDAVYRNLRAVIDKLDMAAARRSSSRA